MEPTLTQNCALYYAQPKTSKGGAALFKKLRAAARKRRLDVRRQLTFGELFIAPRWETKGEIRGNVNSYRVTIGRKTPQPVQRPGALKAFGYQD